MFIVGGPCEGAANFPAMEPALPEAHQRNEGTVNGLLAHNASA